MLGHHVLVDGETGLEGWRKAEAYPGIGFLLTNAAHASGATVLRSHLINLPHPELSKPDSPVGGTAWVGLDESHITLHWYEDGDRVRFALDAFTCGKHADSLAIVDYVLERIPGCVGKTIEVDRFKQQEDVRSLGPV